MQEGTVNRSRTVYYGLTMGVTFLFIHLLDYRQQAADDFLQSQQLQLNTDAMTGLYSRHAYTKELQSYQRAGELPENLAVFVVDINNLKGVNDTLGHVAGDELIRAASKCLTLVFRKEGKCVRTGGDEFVIFAHTDRRKAVRLLERLDKESHQKEGEIPLHLAAGYALAKDHPGVSAENLVSVADLAMYEAKRAYYEEQGRVRGS
ncbi:MAG: GGDEF domain-containing protein [Blautia sp.]|nr:GGDEF domain-containing protein [Blautia sp.]